MISIELLLASIAILLAIEFAGLCLLIVWSHKKDVVMKEFNEKLNEILEAEKRIKENEDEKTNRIINKETEDKLGDKAGTEKAE